MKQEFYPAQCAKLSLVFVLLFLLPAGARAASVGDIDQDNDIDLTDVILSLRIVSGYTPAVPEIVPGIDVNNDAKIGLAEVLYALEITATGTPPPLLPSLNDTGITWGGNSPDGNNSDCTSNIAGAQDCSQGRDTTHNDDSDGHAGFSFTKLDAAGDSLPASATSWSCVRDNVTGLVWEVKTDDDTIHDKDNTYGPYEWDGLVDGSNNAGFCGYTDWRVPTTEELLGLVDFGRENPAIDTAYFPNTQSGLFWSASQWYVFFYDGYTNWDSEGEFVRLVRSGQ